MKILSSFVFRLILILGAATALHSAATPIMDYNYRYELNFNLFDGICPIANLMGPLPKCIVPFVRKINEHATRYRMESSWLSQKKITTEVSETIFCCAVNELKACLVEKIGSKCGPDVEKRTVSIVNIIINSDKYVGKQLGNQSSCDTWYYKSPPVFCWERKSQVAVFIILYLACCCCCGFWWGFCSACCRSQRKTTLSVQSPPIVSMNDGHMHLHQRTPIIYNIPNIPNPHFNGYNI